VRIGSHPECTRVGDLDIETRTQPYLKRSQNGMLRSCFPLSEYLVMCRALRVTAGLRTRAELERQIILGILSLSDMCGVEAVSFGASGNLSVIPISKRSLPKDPYVIKIS
jgi:hypothetical protein